jgi:PTS system glucitol/sorbitol-specific IIA component
VAKKGAIRLKKDKGIHIMKGQNTKYQRRSNMKYDVTVTGLGSMALEFLAPGMEMQFVILFNDDAPPELADMAILHTAGTLSEDPAPGDTLKLGSKTYKITAVGDEAIHTLKEMGHCTLAFSSDTTPYRPGCINLDGEIVTKDDVVNGAEIQIF